MEQNNQSGLATAGSQGPVVGIIIVIIVLIIGAFYFFNSIPSPVENETTLPPTSSSTDTQAIENDLNAEDFSSIDQEMGELETEFGE